MRKTLLSTLAVALLLCGSSRATAEESKPVVVVTATSVDRLIANVDTLGEMAESQFFTNIAKAYAVSFARGVDKTKPAGILVTTDGAGFRIIGFVPVTDFKAVMTTLRGEDAGDGAYEVRLGRERAFAKKQGNWAFVSNDLKSLEDLPADPEKMIAGQEKEYDVCIRALVQNVPEHLRDLAVGALKTGVQLADRLDGESEEEFEARMKTATSAIDDLIEVIDDTEHVTIGWSVDDKEKKTFLDFNWVAKSGSSTAKKFAGYENATTRFSGFHLADAAAKYNMSFKVSKEDADQTIAAMKSVRDQLLKEFESNADFDTDEQRAAVKGAINSSLDALEATIDSGKFDGAASVVLKSDAVTFAAGGHVAEAGKVEKAVKEVVAAFKDQPGLPEIELDADSHAGVRIHTMSVPLPDPQATRLFGDNLDIVVGFGDSSVYVAVGRDAMNTLKDAIDKSKAAGETSVSPVEFTVAAGSIVDFAASLQADNPIAGMLADEAAKFKGKDHLRMVVRPIPNGFSSRMEVEHGVINLIGKAIGAFAAAGGRGAF
ncbi:MAG: hypothetical protein WD875_15515 [Pirellulales bacterium]